MYVASLAAVQSAPSVGSPWAIVMLAMGVLLLVIGFLLHYCVQRIVERRMSQSGRQPEPARPPASSPPKPPRPGTMVCPACRREYEFGVRYCPHDSKQLVAAEGGSRSSSGGICPTCKRAFDPGVKFCPHDAEELIPMAFWEATRGRARPSGIIGKICPHCNAKYDLEATFCGKDGQELVAVN